jgi:hypothetical protein
MLTLARRNIRAQLPIDADLLDSTCFMVIN